MKGVRKLELNDLELAIQNYNFKYINEKDIVLSEKLLMEKTKKYIEEHLDNNTNGYYGYIYNVFTKEEYRFKEFQRKVFNKCFEFVKKMGITSFKSSSKKEITISMYSCKVKI